MGVGAAAFATIASQTVSAVLAFAKLMRSQEEWAVRWREVRFDGPSLKAVIVQGLPSGVQNSVISLANVIVQSNINSFGAQRHGGLRRVQQGGGLRLPAGDLLLPWRWRPSSART